eukprot:symbB.v1.2.013008.t1/scaffold914.1/size160365/1
MLQRWCIRSGAFTQSLILRPRLRWQSSLSAIEWTAVQGFRRRAVVDLTTALETSSGTGVPVQLGEKLRTIASEEVTTALGETSSSQAGSLEKEMDSYQNLELDNKVKGFMCLPVTGRLMGPMAMAVAICLVPWLVEALPKANSGLTRLEQEELAFMKSQLLKLKSDFTLFKLLAAVSAMAVGMLLSISVCVVAVLGEESCDTPTRSAALLQSSVHRNCKSTAEPYVISPAAMFGPMRPGMGPHQMRPPMGPPGMQNYPGQPSNLEHLQGRGESSYGTSGEVTPCQNSSTLIATATAKPKQVVLR